MLAACRPWKNFVISPDAPKKIALTSGVGTGGRADSSSKAAVVAAQLSTSTKILGGASGVFVARLAIPSCGFSSRRGIDDDNLLEHHLSTVRPRDGIHRPPTGRGVVPKALVQFPTVSKGGWVG